MQKIEFLTITQLKKFVSAKVGFKLTMLDLVALLRPFVNDLRTVTVSFENPYQFTLRYRDNRTGQQQTRLFSVPPYVQESDGYYFVYLVEGMD